MKTIEIVKREANLIELCLAAKEASTQFRMGVEHAAAQAETSPAVVRRYITALASEKANTLAMETEQLSMLFNVMPTVTEQAA